MTLLADMPVQRKLGYAMLLTSSLALMVSCAVFLAVEYAGYRRNLVQTVATLARITADNSTGPIAFADFAAAQQTLGALHSEPQIVAAALYDKHGRLFAQYLARPGETVPAAPPAFTGTHLEQRTVVAVEPVVEKASPLGTLYLRATQEVMFARIRTSIWVAVGTLVLSTVLASMLAVSLGRTLARPILELGRTADAVSAGQDYSLRARQYGQDELGRLTAAFNAMLATTQKSVDALRESEQRFRRLADHAPVLIWLTDPLRRHVWLNQRWVEFTGQPMADDPGAGWADSVHPDDRVATLRRFESAFESRDHFQFEFRLRRHDGVFRWMLGQGLPRFDAAGEFAGYIGSSVDVSDRKLAEQEVAAARDRALAASRAKDNFLAALSHELRTPLTPVLFLASERAASSRLDPELRADFELIAKNVALEARLIDDLLDLTRITRGKLVLERQPADAHVILRDALATVRAEPAARDVKLVVELGALDSRVHGDPVRLQQVFWNVLKNAAKFTPPGGQVTVQTGNPDRTRILVRVADTGIGMTPAELGRVFDAFAQGDHADTPGGHRFGGLGLGLAITERLVQLHAGVIRASSPGRGQGAVFEIELPLETAPAAPAPRSAPPFDSGLAGSTRSGPGDRASPDDQTGGRSDGEARGAE